MRLVIACRLLAKYYAQCMKFGDREDDLHAFITRLCECLEILVAATPQQTQAEQVSHDSVLQHFYKLVS